MSLSKYKFCFNNELTEQEKPLKTVTLLSDHHKLYVRSTIDKKLSNSDDKKEFFKYHWKRTVELTITYIYIFNRNTASFSNWKLCQTL